MKSMSAKDRLKKLRNFKVYNKNIFSDLNKSEVKEELHLAKKRNQIVWLDDREFYKRPESYWDKEIGYVQEKRKSIQHNRKIKIRKYPIFKKWFWSNPNGCLFLDNYICVVLYQQSILELDRLLSIFGNKAVYRSYLNGYRKKNMPLIYLEEELKL